MDAIPVNAPPPRQPSSGDANVSELCQRIPLTADRLRHAAFASSVTSRRSPAVTSVSRRRDALASAIITHASELVLRTLTQRPGQLGLEPTFQTQLNTAALPAQKHRRPAKKHRRQGQALAVPQLA